MQAKTSSPQWAWVRSNMKGSVLHFLSKGCVKYAILRAKLKDPSLDDVSWARQLGILPRPSEIGPVVHDAVGAPAIGRELRRRGSGRPRRARPVQSPAPVSVAWNVLLTLMVRVGPATVAGLLLWRLRRLLLLLVLVCRG